MYINGDRKKLLLTSNYFQQPQLFLSTIQQTLCNSRTHSSIWLGNDDELYSV